MLRLIYDCQIGWWTSAILIFLLDIMSGLRRDGIQLFTYNTYSYLWYFTYQLSYPVAAERAPPFSTTPIFFNWFLPNIRTSVQYIHACHHVMHTCTSILITIASTLLQHTMNTMVLTMYNTANLAKPLSACCDTKKEMKMEIMRLKVGSKNEGMWGVQLSHDLDPGQLQDYHDLVPRQFQEHIFLSCIYS